MSETIKKVLFVEDDPVVLTLYRNRLQREGFEVLFAEDGQVALNVLSQVRPDLVVLDLMLPKVNGVEVLKQIRADARLKTTPVLILSNAYMTEMAQKAMNSGANKGMLKTECTPAKLVEAIRDLLGYDPVFAPTKSKNGKSQAEAFVAAAATAHADEMSLKEAREEFINDAPTEIVKIREHCLAYIKAAASPTGLQQLNNLFQRVHFLSARAGLAGCGKIALLASAFEALLFEVVFKPSDVTASILQTIAQAVDCLGRLFHNGETGSSGMNPRAKILVVDDDAVCNFTMVAALKRAHLDPVSVEDPKVAIQLLQAGRYDIVLLDINMPGMSGFELCEELRRMPAYRETPVIFITGNGDFQNRAQGILSGGNDLITKPTSPLELVLKATMHLLLPQGRRTEAAATETTQRLDTLPTVLQSASALQASQPQPAAAVPTARSAAPKAKPPVITEPPAEVIKLIQPEATRELPRSKGHRQTDQPGLRVEMPEPRVSREAMHTKNGNGTPQPMSGNGTSQPKASNGAPQPKASNGAPQLEVRNKPQPPSPRKPLSRPSTAPRIPKANHNHVTLIMDNQPHKPASDGITDEVARIIFGDENLTDMNVRLTRIALERYNVAEGQAFEDVVQGVARIIFGDENLTDMNVRLTRIALERYNVPEALNCPVQADSHRPAAVDDSSSRAARLAMAPM